MCTTHPLKWVPSPHENPPDEHMGEPQYTQPPKPRGPSPQTQGSMKLCTTHLLQWVCGNTFLVGVVPSVDLKKKQLSSTTHPLGQHHTHWGGCGAIHRNQKKKVLSSTTHPLGQVQLVFKGGGMSQAASVT
ncbi:hypothetical protein BS47DRAFT_1369356 [Hydnum rufescens UP504]|uniref:Uncharacterized protein n=1 Tax=Hydnum rufescens UP504 TaxID=1448309 RepID=A0A9P6ADG9_9AGAM|nr:hypothetical protein BS47DRAFT_1369356 [Hydnum rufescens UP504]